MNNRSFTRRLCALLLAVIMVLAFSVTAFAEPSASDADTAASSSDASVVTPTDHLGNYTLRSLSVDYFRLNMLVPTLDGLTFGVDNTNAELNQMLSASYGISGVEDILNYTDYYGNSNCYLYNSSSANNNVVVSITYSENNYTRYIGDYSRLSKEQLEDVRTGSDAFGTGTSGELRSINGRTFIYQSNPNSETNSVDFLMNTIVNGGSFDFYIQVTEPTDLDYDMVDSIFQSIKVKGVDFGNYGLVSRTVSIVLWVIIGLLVLVVALLTFFIIRFNAFAKAAGSSFSIIGFNMPPKAESGDGTVFDFDDDDE